MSAGAGAGAGSARDRVSFTCIMVLAVHGAVFIEEITKKEITKTHDVDKRDSVLKLGPSYQIRALALDDIGKGVEAGDSGAAEAGVGDRAKVVCLVSPSNIGYSIMNSEYYQFLTHVQAFIRFVESGSSNFNGSQIAEFFSEYENRLYSFFDQRMGTQRINLEQRFRARATMKDLDLTQKLVAYHPEQMLQHDFNQRMITIRNDLGLKWKPRYDFCIGSKSYCPGGTANQCCLFFPEEVVDGTVFERLRSKLLDYNMYNRQKSQPTPGTPGTQDLSADLRLSLDSHTKCVLTIIFDSDSTDGLVKNQMWRGISLDQFFRQVKQLLIVVFSDVEGFNVEAAMARTCVVDAACSDFSVRGKKVSIIGFEKAGVGAGAGAGAAAGVVSAFVDVHDRDDEFLDFWEYWIRHTPTSGVARSSSRSQHRVYIPRELEEFVPECLTCLGATIRKVEPVFDDQGNVVRVRYTYFDDRIEEVDYSRSVSGPRSDSMEAVHGSVVPQTMNAESPEVVAGSQSVEPPNTVRATMAIGGRHRVLHNSKKKSNKRKTMRRRKMIRKKSMKSRRFTRSRS